MDLIRVTRGTRSLSRGRRTRRTARRRGLAPLPVNTPGRPAPEAPRPSVRAWPAMRPSLHCEC